MKHFVNEIETAISESIDGYLRVYGRGLLSRLADEAGHKIVLRRKVDKKKVSLVSGGGSGHEPSHVGFVGEGMLTAAVCGEIFASPSVDAVLTAIRAVTGPAGCLLIVKNYAGDRLNFGLAAEKARAEGLRVEMVIVADDIAIENAPRPRGVAGTLFVHKIAGHAAESGLNLRAVRAAAERAVRNIQSIGIATTGCTIPGRAAHVGLPEGVAELGLGIHGEPGFERIQLPNANEVARLMTARFGSGPKKAASLAMILNNLGGVPAMEMSLLANAILETDIGRKARFIIGPAPLMTALDMRGFSISVLVLDSKTSQALLAPTSAPAWPGAKAVDKVSQLKCSEEKGRVAFKPSKNVERKHAIESVCAAIIQAEAHLNLLDAKVGDGDTGSTMANAARAVVAAIDKLPLANDAHLCGALADQFAKVMGGSSGVLLSILSAATGHALGQGASWAAALNAGLDRVEFYGGAREGDRTMLDALRPAIRVLEKGGDLTAAAAAAEIGAEKTAGMTSARAGRSSYLAAHSLKGVPDPGAVAAAKALRALPIGQYGVTP
jgi:triose/dihydroxyacetone kinase / FAD-AMP lyase (cyclizing)